MVRTQIQLTEDQVKGLKRLAKKQGISFAEIIRRSADRTLRENYAPSEDELWERAMKAVGCGHSGLNDVSERHDDYLVEAYLE
jgi:hypothetical protein